MEHHVEYDEDIAKQLMELGEVVLRLNDALLKLATKLEQNYDRPKKTPG